MTSNTTFTKRPKRFGSIQLEKRRRSDTTAVDADGLVALSISPLYYRRWVGGVATDIADNRSASTKIVTDSLRCSLLDNAWAKRFVIGGPINEKTGKPFGPTTKAFLEWSVLTGKTAMTDEEFGRMYHLKEEILRHPEAGPLLENGSSGWLHCSSIDTHIDWMHPDRGMVFLVPIENLRNTCREFQRRSLVLRAGISAYAINMITFDAQPPPVHMVFAEIHEPHRVVVLRLSDAMIDHAKRRASRLLSILEICQRSDVWPTNTENIRHINSLDDLHDGDFDS